MMVASHLRFALLAFLCLLSYHHTSSQALPATSQNPPSNPALQIQNSQAIERNIRRLILDLAFIPNVRYNQSKLILASFAIDHVEDAAHPSPYRTRTNNIADFRDIVCIFQYGGGPPPPDPLNPPGQFRMKNRWPFFWEQWLPPRDGPRGRVAGLPLPIDWDMVMARMPIGRADALLKASGHWGVYAQVGLFHLRAPGQPLAWCFYGVEVLPGVYGEFRVDVQTGQVL